MLKRRPNRARYFSILFSFTVLIAVSALGPVRAVGQTVLRVDADAPGPTHDGLTWATAFTDLQAGLAATAGDDEIWVANGTYMPDGGYTPTGGPHVPGSGDRAATFQVVDGVAIYGGFPNGGGDGTFAARDPDPATNGATLSGDLNNDDQPDFVNNEENSLHVVTGSGTDNTAVLDGFTVSGGNANIGNFPDCRGGGVFNDSGSPTLSNCIFTSNNAGADGGAINNDNGGEPVLANCRFDTNSAGSGGAVANHAGSTSQLTSCTFTGNTATSGGGGAMVNVNSSPALIDCTFTGNAATLSMLPLWGRGGGIYNNTSSSPTLTDCTFTGNTANGHGGGGMYNDGGNPTLTNCKFIDNSSGNDGGAVYNVFSTTVLTGCIFTNNSSVQLGGAIRDTFSSTMLTDCHFIGNSVGNIGAGIFSSNSPNSTLTGCMFIGNAATGPGGGTAFNVAMATTMINCLYVGNVSGVNAGGALNCDVGNTTMTNCTFVRNSAGTAGGGVDVETGNVSTLTNCILWENTPTQIDGDPATVTYSDVQGGIAGTANIDTNPSFVGGPSGTWTADAIYDLATGQTTLTDSNALYALNEYTDRFLNPDNGQILQSLIVSNTPTEIVVWGDFTSLVPTGGPYPQYQINDYHLMQPSPCRDSGNNDYVDGTIGDPVPTDLEGNARVVDGDGDLVADVDMGCYENELDCNMNNIPDQSKLACGDTLSVWTGDGLDDNWSSAANWCPEIVPNGTNFSVEIGPGADVQLDLAVTICSLLLDATSTITADDAGNTLSVSSDDLLANDGTITIAEHNNNLTASGMIDNTGMIIINGGTSGSANFLPGASGATFENSGAVVLGSGLNPAVVSAPGLSVTNGSTHTIRGAGRIEGSLVNQGELLANVPGGVLIIDGDNDGNLLTNSASNSGMIKASAGRVELVGMVDQTGGGVLAAEGSGEVRLTTDGSTQALVEGGTIDQADGLVTLRDSARIKNLTVSSGLVVPGDAIGVIEGTITNQQIIRVNGVGGASPSRLQAKDAAAQLEGTGRVLLESQNMTSAIESVPESAMITNGADHTIEGVGEITANLTNQGLVLAKRPIGGGHIHVEPERDFRVRQFRHGHARGGGRGWRRRDSQHRPGHHE